MIRPRTTIAVALAGLAAAAVLAGCGGSDTPAATTAADGGSPASSAQNRMTAAAFTVVSNYPRTPICNPGGLPNEDEETCAHFWNHMLQWTSFNSKTGPTLDGVGNGSMIYKGFTGLQDDTHWWGPSDLQNCTGNIKQNPNYCVDVQPGLLFGKKTNIETYDNGSETESEVTWKLQSGDVNFGEQTFRARNNGGAGGSQGSSCRPGQWISCSKDGGQAVVENQQPEGNDEDYASFGWVIETYPILVRIENKLPGAQLVEARAAGQQVAFSRNQSSPSLIDTSTDGAKLADAESSLWAAGFRTREGDGLVSVTGRLEGTGEAGKSNSYHNAPFSLSVEFAQKEKGTGTTKQPVAPSCKVQNTNVGGDSAKCLIKEFLPGGRSEAGVLQVSIVSGS